MDTIVCKKVDEVYNKLILEPGIGFEISEYFTFDVPGAKFTPAYRNKVWDGKISRITPVNSNAILKIVICYFDIVISKIFEVNTIRFKSTLNRVARHVS